jgi:pimeloyl-ACP methyl ester carboxylesterase
VFNLKNGEFLNYIDIQKHSEDADPDQNLIKKRSKKPTLILMHGYGSGLGMFFGLLHEPHLICLIEGISLSLSSENYELFSQRFDRVIAVDWLGMGGSSRPKCSDAPKLSMFNGWSCAPPMDPTKATDFFIDSLEVCLISLPHSPLVSLTIDLPLLPSRSFVMKTRSTILSSLVILSVVISLHDTP